MSTKRDEPEFLNRADVAIVARAIDAGEYVPVRMLRALARTADALYAERRELAKLAADTPQFDNPLKAFGAQTVRDQVLRNPNHVTQPLIARPAHAL